MLCRSLFEDMVDVHWVADNPDLAPERLLQHDRYSRHLRSETQRAFPDFFDGKEPLDLELSDEELENHRRLFGPYGSKSWTGIPGTHDRIEAIAHHWDTDADRTTLRFWGAWVNKMMSEVLHPSGLSLGRLGAPEVDDDDSFEWRFGGTIEWLTQALFGALWIYAQIVGLVLDRFAPDQSSELTKRFEESVQAFRDAAHWEASGTLETVPDP